MGAIRMEDRKMSVRFINLDVSDPTRAQVTFSLNAVDEDGVERKITDLVVDETHDVAERPLNTDEVIASAKFELAIKMKWVVDTLKAQLPSHLQTKVDLATS